MTAKITLDPEIKLELLIKLAFGIPIEILTEEYDLTPAKIINLRKNNYTKYNEFLEHWKIDKEVACLGLTPKFERALNIVKKHYTYHVRIESEENIYFKGKWCSLTDILLLADKILRKDNINDFMTCTYLIKNQY